jgi:hypothetical protein
MEVRISESRWMCVRGCVCGMRVYVSVRSHTLLKSAAVYGDGGRKRSSQEGSDWCRTLARLFA